jgi:outer membrane protein
MHMSNRRRGLLTAAAFGAGLALVAGAASAESLADAIALAYRTNPQLQQQRAQQRVVDEEYVQAEAGLRPQLSITGTTTYFNGFNSSFGSNIKLQTSTAGIMATQQVYTGGRVANAVNAAQADILAGRETLRATESQVMALVIQAYVDVRRDQESLRINQANREVLQKQLDQVNAQFEVGEVTRTDVAQAQARLAQAVAAVATAQATLEISRAGYVQVVGQQPGTLEPEPGFAHVPDSFEAAMDVAVQANPNLRAAQYQQQATHHRVAEARSSYMPEVNATANYGYGIQPNFGVRLAQRAATTITGQVSMPLFTGGLTGSQVRVAIERDNAARVGVTSAERTVLLNVSQAWARVLSTRATETANEQQVKADEIAAEGSRQEYQVGLRTTIDVLNAEQELRDAQLALINSQHDNYVASAQLLEAMGLLEAKVLVPNVRVYDPKANFNRVRWRGTVLYDKVLEAVDQVARPRGGHADATLLAPIDTDLRTKGVTPSPRRP